MHIYRFIPRPNQSVCLTTIQNPKGATLGLVGSQNIPFCTGVMENPDPIRNVASVTLVICGRRKGMRMRETLCEGEREY